MLKADNIAPLPPFDLTPSVPVLHKFRRMCGGWSEGIAVEIGQFAWREHSVLELMFIGRAWQAAERRAQSGLEPSEGSAPVR